MSVYKSDGSMFESRCDQFLFFIFATFLSSMNVINFMRRLDDTAVIGFNSYYAKLLLNYELLFSGAVVNRTTLIY